MFLFEDAPLISMILCFQRCFDKSICLCSRGEASQLLFQPGYIHVLKQMALSGQLQKFNIRSVAWRVSSDHVIGYFIGNLTLCSGYGMVVLM